MDDYLCHLIEGGVCRAIRRVLNILFIVWHFGKNDRIIVPVGTLY